ncbi:OmpA family protein [Olleya sp. YS]|uniref:OmpA family protein n=1 Tax=Olleya sp. YS TaxID=3028318 RepID=UPI0024346082|nr:OmpA family protein [Olleya sp. YS]WGD34381.1 OmpA family protein [Olleya sp. YS]
MKYLTTILSICFLVFSFQSVEAQIWKKIQKKAERKIEQKADEKIDDILEEKKDEKIPEEQEEEQQRKEDAPEPENKKESPNHNSSEQKTPEIWRNYKFIPGEKVIFYDDLRYEEVGEFPSRWDLVKGGAEIARFNGEKVIIGTAEYNNRITPLFNNPNYLGDEFTIEFDVYVESADASNFWTEIEIIFDSKKLKYSSSNDVRLMLSNGKNTTGHASNSSFALEKVSLGKMNAWHHIAMSYNKGKFKLYYDEKRISNLPKFYVVPDVVAIQFRGYSNNKQKLNAPIKNIRIAHGGGQMYKRISSEGKYVTNGILFDSGKADMQPQSMGVINKIAEVMTENPDWSFQIIGHTDSDGTTESNLSLSQQRAEAVKQALINLGINETRLSTLGKGESEPLNTNSNPEEKANNRRVEFLKI